MCKAVYVVECDLQYATDKQFQRSGNLEMIPFCEMNIGNKELVFSSPRNFLTALEVFLTSKHDCRGILNQSPGPIQQGCGISTLFGLEIRASV